MLIRKVLYKQVRRASSLPFNISLMKRQHSEHSDKSEEEEQEALGADYVKMPKKAKHRMRAHINPMGDLTIP